MTVRSYYPPSPPRKRAGGATPVPRDAAASPISDAAGSPASDICGVPSPARGRVERRHSPGPSPKSPRPALPLLWPGLGDGSEDKVDKQAVSLLDRSSHQRQAWEVDAAELELHECVGVGANAEVYRALWHGTEVAVKQLRSGCTQSQFEKELSILRELRHPNLVLFMGASCSRGCRPAIVTEFCAGGTLFRLLHERQRLQFDWEQRRRVALDVAKGMNFLHRRRVIHRDLKSLNVLLAADVEFGSLPSAKIADFGLSRHIPAATIGAEGPSIDDGQMTRGLGTYLWMGPEVLGGAVYDQRADVYSYGMLLYEVVCRRLPFEGSGLQPISIAMAVTGGARPDLRCAHSGCPPALLAVLEDAWAQAPSQRPSFMDILQSLQGMASNCGAATAA